VPTSFFLHGTSTDPQDAPAEPLPRDGQADHDLIVMDRIPPEPFFARPDRTDDLVTRLQPAPTPFFVRLPYGSGHYMLRVHRLLRDRVSDWLLVHWAGSSDDPTIADTCEVEQDLVARCREAAGRTFSGQPVTGTVILMHGGPAGMHMALTAQVAPLLLREVLSGARHPHWMVIGIGAPIPA
jgi:hypothetical protein